MRLLIKDLILISQHYYSNDIKKTGDNMDIVYDIPEFMNISDLSLWKAHSFPIPN